MIVELLKKLITKKILQRKSRHREQIKCILCNE